MYDVDAVIETKAYFMLTETGEQGYVVIDRRDQMTRGASLNRYRLDRRGDVRITALDTYYELSDALLAMRARGQEDNRQADAESRLDMHPDASPTAVEWRPGDEALDDRSV